MVDSLDAGFEEETTDQKDDQENPEGKQISSVGLKKKVFGEDEEGEEKAAGSTDDSSEEKPTKSDDSDDLVQ